jgi:hypothetical protein
VSVNRKDLATGLIFMAFGLFYGIYAYRDLTVGQLLKMGPGYFPVVLSSFIALLGVVIALRSFFAGQGSPFGVVPWRAVVMLSLSTVVFAAFLQVLGMLPGVFVTALLACLASSQIKLLPALAISLGIALFCVLVFSYGIRLPVPVFGHWVGG